MSESPNRLSYSSKLGRSVRTGDAELLGRPTDELVVGALRSGDRQSASEWFAYLLTETSTIATVYRAWLASMITFGESRVEHFEAELQQLTNTIGAPPPIVDPNEIAREEADQVRHTIESGDCDHLAAALAELRRAQWRVHDDQADWCWGLLTVFWRKLGENRMEEVYRETLGEWFTARYESLGDLTRAESFELAIEGMRAHFCGPSDDTHVDVSEESDRWIMSFDPCGSGGRMRRGDPIRGQQTRTTSPYSFGYAEEAHDWTWGEKGVCLYCAHCSMVNEILPIEMTGAPMRITEYPKEPGDKCKWTVYKSADAIPAEAYARVGKSKPPGSDD